MCQRCDYGVIIILYLFMAITQLSGIGITGIRNKQGNLVFTVNRSGSISRAWVNPTNTITIPRVNARNNFATCVSLWSALSSSEVGQWNAFAQRHRRKNTLGKLFTPTGRAMFIECNLNLLQSFLLPISTPVFNQLCQPIQRLSISSVSAVSLMCSPLFLSGNAVVPAGHVLSVAASPSVSTGINYPKNFFIQISVLPELTNVNTFDFITDYIAQFPLPVAGQKLFVKFTLVNELSGLRSKPIISSTIIS